MMLPAVLLVFPALLIGGCGRNEDYSENEYFECSFQAERPLRNIQRTSDIPYRLTCRCKQESVEFSYITVSVYHKEDTSREIGGHLRSDADRYNRYSHKYRPRVESHRLETLSHDPVGEQKRYLVTQERPLVIRGSIRHRPKYRIYYRDRFIRLTARIEYPDDPLFRSNDRARIRSEMRKNPKKYFLRITQRID
ncbi:MAG: hypothetical protein JXA20_06540 [Spirochaetes bacterium]|nr:hypothetical protein [Spirochaetota bacterium]